MVSIQSAKSHNSWAASFALVERSHKDHAMVGVLSQPTAM